MRKLRFEQLCKNNEVFQRENFCERFFQVALCGQSLKRPIGRDQIFGVETLSIVYECTRLGDMVLHVTEILASL